MSKEGKSNKIITVILALVIIIAAFTIIYINLDEDSDEGNEENNDINLDDTSDEIILTLSYGDETKEYTLNMLENFVSYTQNGGIIKTGWFPDISTEGPFNYTGVKISTLLDEIINLPENYNITITSNDDRRTEYNQSQINGNINVYNGTSTEAYDVGGVTMVIAYNKETEYLDDEEGPLRIVFVDDGIFTSANLWARFVVSIEITEI